MIKDWLVNFYPIIESVLNSRLNIVLLPNFIFIGAPMTKPTNTFAVLPGDDTNKKNPRKRKTANGNDDNNRIVKNTAPVKEFFLKEGEDWSKNFARKCTSDHPKLDVCPLVGKKEVFPQLWEQGQPRWRLCHSPCQTLQIPSIPYQRLQGDGPHSHTLGLTPQAGISQCSSRQPHENPDNNSTLPTNHDNNSTSIIIH